MKKLLVTAIGAAVAFGAFAAPVSSQRFEEATERGPIELSGLNTLAGGNYWSDTRGATTNTYEIEAFGSYVQPTSLGAPTNALKVATKFGQPLEVKSTLGDPESIGDGLYFDSLVKFTVCDDDPSEDICTNAYKDAKIVMWLKENEDQTKTNIMVRAGYLSKDNNDKVQVVSKTYDCGTIDLDIDKFHRVTIKAIENITTTSTTVPAFAIYIDGKDSDGTAFALVKCTTDAKWDGSFDLSLTPAAAYLNNQYALFPSLVQAGGTKTVIAGASFDGTGSISDLVFTHDVPEFAKDHGAPVSYVTIGGLRESYETFEEALQAVNGISAQQTATLELAQNMALTEPLVFSTTGTVTLDFAGFVLTNTVADAAITNSAATLIVTNSSVGVGGIYCSDANGGAIATVGGATTINDGWFYGNITVENANLAINGGCFKQGYQALKSYLPSTKITEEVQAMGLTFNKVVDYVPEVYTITFNTMGGAFADPTEATQEVTEGNYVQKPTDPEKSGATFVKWVWDDDGDGETPMVEFIFDSDPEERESTEVTDDYVLFAEWYVVPEYTVTFRTNNVEFATQNVASNSTATAPSPAPTAATGYTFNGWYEGNSAVAYDFATPVTGNLTLDAKFDLVTYTITFVNEIGADPASTNYTIESSTITLPTATTENMGVQFDGWTNATITAAITEFTPTAENVGNFTLYAKWSSTGSSGYDGGNGGTFTIDPGAVATVETVTGHSMTDTVAGKGMT